VTHDTSVAEKRCIRRVLRGARVLFPLFVDSTADVRGTQTRDRLHTAKEVVDQITPVAEQVRDDPAAIFLSIVPRRALARLISAVKYPIAELSARREDSPEELRIDEVLQL